jgi:transcriptional regulator with XRE-family HTH domain
MIGTAIQNRREKNGWTRTEAASKSGISAATWKRVESGACTPRDATLRIMALHLGTEVEALKASAARKTKKKSN